MEILIESKAIQDRVSAVFVCMCLYIVIQPPLYEAKLPFFATNESIGSYQRDRLVFGSETGNVSTCCRVCFLTVGGKRLCTSQSLKSVLNIKAAGGFELRTLRRRTLTH